MPTPERKQYNREYHLAHRKAASFATREWCERYPERYLLNRARGNAKRIGVACTITVQDIVIPEVCPFLGFPLKVELGKGPRRQESPSIDRIDNCKGYVPGNVQVISHMANAMKQDASIAQLIFFAKNVLKRYGGDACAAPGVAESN